MLYYARDIGKAKIQAIDWKRHKLGEPKEQIDDAEQIKLFNGLRDDYQPLAEVAILLGLRRGELIKLEWRDVQFGTRKIIIRNGKGKDGGDETVPMLPKVREILWQLHSEDDRHPDYVFTWVSTKNDRKRGRRKGERYPYTAEGWKSAFARAVEKAGLTNLRMHDTRHTAASRLHREIGLRGVQTVLRHADISTTQKYAHVRDDELMEALQRAAESAEARQARLREPGAQIGSTMPDAEKKDVG